MKERAGKNSVLFLYENDMPSVTLMKEGIRESQIGERASFISVKTIKREDLNRSSVVFLIRPTDLFSYHIARWAGKTGRLVIISCDDDLYYSPTDSSVKRSRVRYLRKTIAVSDVLHTCSPRIAEKYRGFVRQHRTVITNTSVDKKDIVPHQGKNEKIKIVYAAGLSHSALFEERVSPVVRRLYDDLGDVFTLTFIGAHPAVPNMEDTPIEIRYVPLMPMNEYRQFMEEGNYDVGIAPLNSDEFSKCKYFNKFFEYAMFGIVGVYSNTEPYTYVIENRKNGLLVDDGAENWYHALREIILSESLRTECSLASQRTLLERFSRDNKKNGMCDKIPELLEDASEKGDMVDGVRFFLTKILYTFQKGVLFFLTSLEYLKSNGLSSLIRKVKKHINYKKVFH